MITARRLRDRVKGEPADTQVRLTRVTVEQHKRALQELTREYEQKIAKASEGSGDAELRKRLKALEAENAELSKLLEQATASEGPDQAPEGKKSGKSKR